MDGLRNWTARMLVGAFVGLLAADVVDDMLFGNRWSGTPKEMYAVVGALVAALFAADALRRNGGGKKR